MKHILFAALIMLPIAARAEELPIPPVPPRILTYTEIAPVPDADATAPVPRPSNEPTVDIRLFRNKPYDPGLGFAPGSHYQTSEDRKPIQTPGLSINVPLR